MVSKTMLAELKIIMKEDYGIDMPEELLSEFGNALVQYFEVLTRVSSGGQNG